MPRLGVIRNDAGIAIRNRNHRQLFVTVQGLGCSVALVHRSEDRIVRLEAVKVILEMANEFVGPREEDQEANKTHQWDLDHANKTKPAKALKKRTQRRHRKEEE